MTGFTSYPDLASRDLAGDEALEASVTLEIPGLGLRFRVDDTIALS